jgi:hypothetical protein
VVHLELHTHDQVRASGFLARLLDWRPEQAIAFRPEAIIVLTFDAMRIEEITAFRSPELFPLFGLPEQLPL